MELVERDTELRLLTTHLQAVASGSGRCVLVGGEAGIGKSTLLRACAQNRADAAVWWGACDALQTPHPLAPLHDVARSVDVGFGALLRETPDNVHALFGAVLAELARSPRPVLFVIEDVHWADDATLDLLQFVGRRIDRVPCLLALSYRDDELSPGHRLRRLFGELPASFVTRLAPRRFSAEAVERMAREALRPADGVHAATGGNPLFVTELLRHGSTGVPHGVQDLVLAQYARLPAAAQALVRLASVVPARLERWLLDGLRAPDVEALEACLNSGLLTAGDGVLAFRHELARVAIEGALSEPVAEALHAEVLHALERARADPQRAAPSLARLVHHATRAADRAAILAHAPEAARQADQRGAHREAAAHYRTALAYAADADTHARATWLAAHARACQATDQLEEAIDARHRLVALHRAEGDALREADNLSQLALVLVVALRNAEADRASRAAIEILEALPPGPALASAYRVEAQLRMLDRDCVTAVAMGRRAIELARAHGDGETLAAAVGTVGTATLFLDYDAGRAQLEEALALALASGAHYVAANAYSNLGSGSGEVFRLREAERHLREGVAFATLHEIDFYRNYALAWLALCEMHLGRWDDAADHAQDILQHGPERRGRNTSRVMALVALGRLQARRGDAAAGATLDEALTLALASDTLQRIAPVRAARAEAAWLRGDRAATLEEAMAAWPLAARRQHPWFIGELAHWLARAGAAITPPPDCAAPHALALRGDWRGAAAAWDELGCPYEAAQALADGDVPARLTALATFERLGARPAAERLRAELRSAGVRQVPRGARASTQTNPHQLTDRECEVLALLCAGLRNSEIAERLCRSVRTVDHHLAAAFVKLEVSSRTEAVAAALAAGLGAARPK